MISIAANGIPFERLLSAAWCAGKVDAEFKVVEKYAAIGT
jgi:hypothetical protein